MATDHIILIGLILGGICTYPFALHHGKNIGRWEGRIELRRELSGRK